jgi:hypothetical protein
MLQAKRGLEFAHLLPDLNGVAQSSIAEAG